MRNYFFFKIESPLGTVTPARLPQQGAIHLPCPHEAHSSFYFKSLSDPFHHFFTPLAWLSSPSLPIIFKLFVFHLDSSQRTPLFVSTVIPSMPYLFYSFPPRVRSNSSWLAHQTRPDPIFKERKHYTRHACHSNFSSLSNIELSHPQESKTRN